MRGITDTILKKNLLAKYTITWGWLPPQTSFTDIIDMHGYVLSHFSFVRLCKTLWTLAAMLLWPWNSPGKNSAVGFHALLQGIFLIEPMSLMSPVLAGRLFTTIDTWETRSNVVKQLILLGLYKIEGSTVAECIHSQAYIEHSRGYKICSVQFSCSVVSDSLWPHELQHTRMKNVLDEAAKIIHFVKS